MATSADLLADAFDRVKGEVHRVLDGLGSSELVARIEPTANTIAWLVWHLTRIQDDHIADVAGRKQVWHDAGWVDRFDLPFDPDATGFGQSPLDVGEVRPTSVVPLTGYHDAVHERTQEFVAGLRDRDLDRVVDERWDPPVTLGVRLVSVVSDDLQHVGQAALLRGLLQAD
ncbi:MAG: mycothiol transferase [Mycobacteriales bacterium]